MTTEDDRAERITLAMERLAAELAAANFNDLLREMVATRKALEQLREGLVKVAGSANLVGLVGKLVGRR